MVTTTSRRYQLQRNPFVHSIIKQAIYTSLCIHLAPYCAQAQALSFADSTDEFESPEPARNRLFTMSTGRTMSPGKLSVADFEFFLLQLGYAPVGPLQINLSYLIPVTRGTNTYWSLGTKFQVLRPSGVFQGLALGADFGFFERVDYITPANSYSSSPPPLVNVNLAASLGDENLKVHMSIAQLQWSADYGKVTFPSYVQAGADISVSRPTARSGLKLMGEITFTQHVRSLTPAFMLFGVRSYGPKFTGDFGWIFGFESSGSFIPGKIPFFSFNVYL